MNLISHQHSRPGVSDDNAPLCAQGDAENRFRIAKYRSNDLDALANLEAAQAWALCCVGWYNHDYKHRNRMFIGPAQGSIGVDRAIFPHRIAVPERAQAKNPERGSHNTSNGFLPDEV